MGDDIDVWPCNDYASSGTRSQLKYALCLENSQTLA